MAQQTRTVIKDWFRTGLKPLQSQFWDWIDSFWHKSDSIPQSSITGLTAALPTTTQLQQLTDLQPITQVISASGTVVIPANKFLQHIVLTTTADNTVKVGFTASGNEIDENLVVANEAYVTGYPTYFLTQTTIHFTGNCTAIIYLR